MPLNSGRYANLINRIAICVYVCVFYRYLDIVFPGTEDMELIMKRQHSILRLNLNVGLSV